MQAHYLLVSLSGHVRSALCERSRILQKKRALKIGDFASSEVQRWVVTKSGLTTLATRAQTIRACRPPPTGRRRHGMGTEKTVADSRWHLIVDHCRRSLSQHLQSSSHCGDYDIRRSALVPMCHLLALFWLFINRFWRDFFEVRAVLMGTGIIALQTPLLRNVACRFALEEAFRWLLMAFRWLDCFECKWLAQRLLVLLVWKAVGAKSLSPGI